MKRLDKKHLTMINVNSICLMTELSKHQMKRSTSLEASSDNASLPLLKCRGLHCKFMPLVKGQELTSLVAGLPIDRILKVSPLIYSVSHSEKNMSVVA